jgi:hypothetical protein
MNGAADIELRADTFAVLNSADQPRVGTHVLVIGGAVEITPDGHIKLLDGATPDEAARAFWNAVIGLAPDFFVNARPQND